MGYKIIIFDLDDTLLDTRENTRTGFKKMLEAQNECYSGDKFQRFWDIDVGFWQDWQDGKIELPEKFANEKGKKSDAFLDYLRSRRVMLFFNNTITNERAVELMHVYTRALAETVIPVEDAYETLDYLHNKYKLVVASNGPGIAAEEKLRKIGVLDFVEEVLTADMLGYMKPRVEFFEGIQARYDDYDKNDYLIVGNSLESDIGLGMNAGIDSCWLDRNEEKLSDVYKPKYIVKRLTDLTKIL